MSPDAIAMFQEWAGHIIPKRISESRVVAIQDGVIVTDDAGAQKEDIATNLFPAAYGSQDILQLTLKAARRQPWRPNQKKRKKKFF